MHPMLKIASQAAREASKIILRGMDHLKDLRIETKGHHDYVSEIDKKAEQVIINKLRQTYPHHGILAEESGETLGDNDSQWIIDPIDGTTNYLLGIPYFCIAIAFQHQNKLQHALIYDPLHQEMFTASHGQGARLNEHRIRVNTKRKLEDAVMGTGFPFSHTNLRQSYLRTFTSMINEVQDIRRMGSAALDLAYVACGRYDGFWEFNLKSWDIAAGILLIQEAGGISCDFNGGEHMLSEGNILATNPKLLKPLLTTIHHAIYSNPST